MAKDKTSHSRTELAVSPINWLGKLRRKSVLACVVAIGYCVGILPYNEKLAFFVPVHGKQLLVSYGLKTLFAVFLYAVIYFVIAFCQQLRLHNGQYRRWLAYSSVYFAVLIVVLLVLYPGHWVHDEFTILDAVKHYSLSYNWQNYFTNIFYTFSLYLFPSPITILVCQVLFASSVVGYVIMQSQRLLHRKHLAYLLYLPFLLFPVILNDLYPLRGMMYSYIELLLICKLLFRMHGLDQAANPYHELAKFSMLITLLCFWRSEGMYYLILLPILVCVLGVFKKRNLRTLRQYGWLVLSGLILLAGFAITKATGSNEYKLTTMVNPLSTMIQQPLHGSNIPERLSEINQVIKVSNLREYPSYNEIPAFWNDGIQPGYGAHIQSFEKQYLYLVIHNPRSFWHNRVTTFLSTNSFNAVPSTSLSMFDLKDYAQIPLAANFLKHNHFVTPFHTNLRARMSRFLLCLTPNDRFNALGHALWNALIPMSLLLLVGLAKLIKRQWVWAGIVALVLVQVPIIFLTAPANYFFYYLPVYMIGYFLAVFVALMYIDRRRA